jgi:hypothetical protein
MNLALTYFHFNQSASTATFLNDYEGESKYKERKKRKRPVLNLAALICIIDPHPIRFGDSFQYALAIG